MIPTLSVKGFRCSVDEVVFSNRRDGFAQLVSLVGSREAVKAIWARLMKGEAAYLNNGSESRPVRIDNQVGAKLLTERLPSSTFHGLLLSNTLLRGELVLCESEDELPSRLYQLLTRRLHLPLAEAWKDWLWAYALESGTLSQLTTMRLHAFEVSLTADDFEKAVRLALVARELPEVEVRHAA